jgi:ubiquinone/menaquinone biosynthesis C-methylase UbiE
MSNDSATERKVLHYARLYDLGLRLITLGRETAMRERMLDQAKICAGEAVLDVGCGTGTLAIAASKRVGAGGKVQGIDPSLSMVSRAQDKARRVHAKAEFQIGTIEALPFADQSFDVVLSSIMFHHLPNAVRQTGLEQIHRVLKPEGRLFVVDFELPSNPIFAYLRHLHDDSAGLSAIVDAVRASGFTDVEVGPTGYAMLRYLRAARPAG